MHIVAFLEMANKVEASTNIWRRRAHSRHLISRYRSTGARPPWGDDSERDDESNDVVPARQTTSISPPDDSDDDDLDGDTETADNGDPTDVKRARRAEHSTLLGRLGDMNQKYDAAAAVDNRILRADIETREQKRNSEKSDGSEPFAVGKTKHGHASEQHTENPKYYWYRFITKQRVEVNREGLQNRFATNPKNMYETIGITSINHKIESSTL
ncbi:unnamed protein product [Brassica oleracea var. botrytis]|uniref:(rape) hypothetical protein n=1 Tax=Brassica napus TaxID=3708 RepID=A0A816J7V1_BRANA|nr:unnamed protein product [Brassica napus]